MSKSSNAKHRMCRKEGEKLCSSLKCAVSKRNTAPGQHGAKMRRNASEYGKQLREKQKVKFIYGIRETQFRNYYEKAVSKVEPTPTALMRMLESRLDTIVFRAGIASTRAMARQLILHSQILVNEKNVTIASYSVKIGETVRLSPKGLRNKALGDVKKTLSQGEAVGWLKISPDEAKVEIINSPAVEEMRQNFDLSRVVQYYSR